MTDETQGAPRAPRHRGIHDAVVIGGGLVGSAVAYGLRRELEHVAVLDEGDVAYRASRGNFGLVWVQSKGMGLPRYGVWTMTSAGAWPQLAAELLEQTGVDVHLEQRGGLHALLSDEEMEARATFMRTLLAPQSPTLCTRPRPNSMTSASAVSPLASRTALTRPASHSIATTSAVTYSTPRSRADRRNQSNTRPPSQ